MTSPSLSETDKEFIYDFHGAVDDYLQMYQAEGITRKIAYKGCFNICISGTSQMSDYLLHSA